MAFIKRARSRGKRNPNASSGEVDIFHSQVDKPPDSSVATTDSNVLITFALQRISPVD